MAFAPYGSDPSKFALGGQDHVVRLFDIRQVKHIIIQNLIVDIQKLKQWQSYRRYHI